MHREIKNILEIYLIRPMNLSFKLIYVNRKKSPVQQTLTTITCNGYDSTSALEQESEGHTLKLGMLVLISKYYW